MILVHQVNTQLAPRRGRRAGLGAPSQAIVYFFNSSGQWQQVYAGDWGQAQAVGGQYLADGNQSVIAYVLDDVTQQWRIWDFAQNGYTASNNVSLTAPPKPSSGGSPWAYAAFAGLLVVTGVGIWAVTR